MKFPLQSCLFFLLIASSLCINSVDELDEISKWKIQVPHDLNDHIPFELFGVIDSKNSNAQQLLKTENWESFSSTTSGHFGIIKILGHSSTNNTTNNDVICSNSGIVLITVCEQSIFQFTTTNNNNNNNNNDNNDNFNTLNTTNLKVFKTICGNECTTNSKGSEGGGGGGEEDFGKFVSISEHAAIISHSFGLSLRVIDISSKSSYYDHYYDDHHDDFPFEDILLPSPISALDIGTTTIVVGHIDSTVSVFNLQTQTNNQNSDLHHKFTNFSHSLRLKHPTTAYVGFGSSVSIDDTDKFLVVGAPDALITGCAFVFEYNPVQERYEQVAQLDPPIHSDTHDLISFGSAVSISSHYGRTIAIIGSARIQNSKPELSIYVKSKTDNRVGYQLSLEHETRLLDRLSSLASVTNIFVSHIPSTDGILVSALYDISSASSCLQSTLKTNQFCDHSWVSFSIHMTNEEEEEEEEGGGGGGGGGKEEDGEGEGNFTNRLRNAKSLHSKSFSSSLPLLLLVCATIPICMIGWLNGGIEGIQSVVGFKRKRTTNNDNNDTNSDTTEASLPKKSKHHNTINDTFVPSIVSWLNSHGFESSVPSFIEHDIDTSMLNHLTDTQLTELGFTTIGAKIKFKRTVAAYFSSSSPGSSTIIEPSSPSPIPFIAGLDVEGLFLANNYTTSPFATESNRTNSPLSSTSITSASSPLPPSPSHSEQLSTPSSLPFVSHPSEWQSSLDQSKRCLFRYAESPNSNSNSQVSSLFAVSPSLQVINLEVALTFETSAYSIMPPGSSVVQVLKICDTTQVPYLNYTVHSLSLVPACPSPTQSTLIAHLALGSDSDNSLLSGPFASKDVPLPQYKILLCLSSRPHSGLDYCSVDPVASFLDEPAPNSDLVYATSQPFYVGKGSSSKFDKIFSSLGYILRPAIKKSVLEQRDGLSGQPAGKGRPASFSYLSSLPPFLTIETYSKIQVLGPTLDQFSTLNLDGYLSNPSLIPILLVPEPVIGASRNPIFLQFYLQQDFSLPIIADETGVLPIVDGRMRLLPGCNGIQLSFNDLGWSKIPKSTTFYKGYVCGLVGSFRVLFVTDHNDSSSSVVQGTNMSADFGRVSEPVMWSDNVHCGRSSSCSSDVVHVFRVRKDRVYRGGLRVSGYLELTKAKAMNLDLRSPFCIQVAQYSANTGQYLGTTLCSESFIAHSFRFVLDHNSSSRIGQLRFEFELLINKGAGLIRVQIPFHQRNTTALHWIESKPLITSTQSSALASKLQLTLPFLAVQPYAFPRFCASTGSIFVTLTLQNSFDIINLERCANNIRLLAYTHNPHNCTDSQWYDVQPSDLSIVSKGSAKFVCIKLPPAWIFMQQQGQGRPFSVKVFGSVFNENQIIADAETKVYGSSGPIYVYSQK